MNRSFYLFANFFLGLTVAAGLWQSLIRLLLGGQIFSLESFIGWFLVGVIVSLISALFLLKYYYHKKYGFTFWSAAISTLVILCHAFIIYNILAQRQLESYLIPSLFLTLGTSMVYGVSLIFPQAGKMPYLKTAGICMCVLSLIFIVAFSWGIYSPEIQQNGTLEKIDVWVSLIVSLIPVLFIMNFRSEAKELQPESVSPFLHKSLENGLALVGLLAFGFTLVFGFRIANDSYSSQYWQKWNFKKT